MVKIVAFNNPAPGRHTHMFMCPACGYAHCFSAEALGYNGNAESPTMKRPLKIPGHLALYRCESIITNGMIAFGDNCTHQFAGYELVLPDAPTEKDYLRS